MLWGSGGPSLCSATFNWSHSWAGHPWRHCPSASPEPHPETLPWVESWAQPTRPPDSPSITPDPLAHPARLLHSALRPALEPPTSRTLPWAPGLDALAPCGSLHSRRLHCRLPAQPILVPPAPRIPPTQAMFAHSGSSDPRRGVPLPVLLIHRPRSWVPSARSLGDPQVGVWGLSVP